MADRNSPRKHVRRAGVILATADGCGTVAIMRRTGKPKPRVWRWQERFMREAVPSACCATRPDPRAPVAWAQATKSIETWSS